MMKRLLSLKSILIALIIMNSGVMYSQSDSTHVTLKNEFGMHAGLTSGYGFSYRHWFNKVGIQATAFFGQYEEQFGSAGLTLLYEMHETEATRFYFYWSNGFYHFKDRPNSDDTEGTWEENYLNMGFGPGFSWGKIVQFNLMFGYGFYNVIDKFNIYPSLEMGLYYCF